MDQQEVVIEEPKRVRELLRELGLFEEEVLVLVNGRLVTEDTRLKPGDRVQLIRVISSG